MKIVEYFFSNDGTIPNSHFPLLIYKHVAQGEHKTEWLEQTFVKNGWTNNWRDIILPYDHFHSNTHEVLGLASGTALLHVGGKNGQTIKVESGDVIIMPAGVGHYSIDNSSPYQFVGGYPFGADWNLKKSLQEENETTLLNELKNVPFPITDPVFGKGGNLFTYWKNQNRL